MITGEEGVVVPSGSSMFADADGYQAAMKDVLDLLVIHPREFRARLNWIEFLKLYLVRAYEMSPRVAFLTLPPDRAFVTFPARRGSVLVAGGAVLEFGDILVHSPGDRLHQRTTGACHWGYISLSADSLRDLGRTVAGQDLAPPRMSYSMRLSSEDRQRLLRLHAQAGRIAETNLALVGQQEVLYGLEQDLILALVNCLTNGERLADRPNLHHQMAMVTRFEALLAEHPYGQLRIADICIEIGASEVSFRAACIEVLGISPGRYQLLRRLKSLRSELLRVGPETDNAIEIIRRYGFVDVHRFVAEYWKTYGEMPPLPPRGARTKRW